MCWAWATACGTNDKLECFGCANFLKAALVYADMITTVSPSYAEEIQTAYYGERLDGLLRARKQSLFGLLNGIDVVDYNPATDKALAANYTPDDLSGKAVCKKALQEKLGLKVDPDVPIIGMVGPPEQPEGPGPGGLCHCGHYAPGCAAGSAGHGRQPVCETCSAGPKASIRAGWPPASPWTTSWRTRSMRAATCS